MCGIGTHWSSSKGHFGKVFILIWCHLWAAKMTPKARVHPLALYFQSRSMSLNHTPPNWSLQQVKSAESEALGERSY